MICPGCGRESVAGSVFCTYCGSRMPLDVHIDLRRLDKEVRGLRDAVAKRGRADHSIVPWIVFIPFIINVVTAMIVLAAIMSEIFSYDLSPGEMPTDEEILGGLGPTIAVAMIGSIAFYGIFAAITYFLIDGAGKHLEAEHGVREAVFELLRKAEEANPEARSRSPWGTYDTTLETMAQGTKRNPVLWTLVIILPLVTTLPLSTLMANGDYTSYQTLSPLSILVTAIHTLLLFYLLHVLTEDTRMHDQAWTDFATSTRISLAKVGFTAGALETGQPLQTRSSGLYILLSLVTGGIFMFFWWYAILKDRNAHYGKQAAFEDSLVQMLSPGTPGRQVTRA